jgi:Ribose/Galactose Isomerase
MSRVGPPANPLAPESFRERFYGHQSTCRFRTGRRKRRVSGVGAGVCVNKVPGVRAGLIGDHFSAHQGVEDDHGNILCMGGRCVRTRRLPLSIPSLLNPRNNFPVARPLSDFGRRFSEETPARMPVGPHTDTNVRATGVSDIGFVLPTEAAAGGEFVLSGRSGG